MNRRWMLSKGFLLVETCVSLLILGFISSLLAYYFSTALRSSLHIERTIGALFLARSSLEEYKAFKKISSLQDYLQTYSLHYSFERVPAFKEFHLLIVTVSWKEYSSQEAVCLRTLVAR